MASNPYTNKVVYGGNTLIDLSGDTLVSADQLLKGIVAHCNDGSSITGTLETGGGGGNFATGTFTTTDDITSNIVINHNLGAKPKFIIVLSSEANTYSKGRPYVLSFFYLFQYNSKYYGAKYQSPRSNESSYSSNLISNSAGGTTGLWYRCNVEENTFTLKQTAISSTYGIGASSSFFWIAYGD